MMIEVSEHRKDLMELLSSQRMDLLHHLLMEDSLKVCLRVILDRLAHIRTFRHPGCNCIVDRIVKKHISDCGLRLQTPL